MKSALFRLNIVIHETGNLRDRIDYHFQGGNGIYAKGDLFNFADQSAGMLSFLSPGRNQGCTIWVYCDVSTVRGSRYVDSVARLLINAPAVAPEAKVTGTFKAIGFSNNRPPAPVPSQQQFFEGRLPLALREIEMEGYAFPRQN
jgi:hypothetical protein